MPRRQPAWAIALGDGRKPEVDVSEMVPPVTLATALFGVAATGTFAGKGL